MRRHLRRIEQLTGRNLDSPRDRTELWLAFEARRGRHPLRGVGEVRRRLQIRPQMIHRIRVKVPQ
jgi:hypothetical protein